MFLKGWDQIYKIFTLFCFVLIFSLIFIPSINADDSYAQIKVSQPFKNQVVKAGGPAHFVIDVLEFNTSSDLPAVGEQKKQDVKFFYKIYNQDGELINQESETIYLIPGENVTSFQKTFYIPTDSKEGYYGLEVKLVTLDDQELDTEKIFFKIVRVTDAGSNVIIIVLVIGFIIAIVAFFYERRKVRKLKVSRKDFEKYL